MLNVSTRWRALDVLVNLDSRVTVLNAQLFQSKMNAKMVTIHVTLLEVHVLIHNTAMNANVMLDTGILTQLILDALAMAVAVHFSFTIVHVMQIGQTGDMVNYGPLVPSILTVNTMTDTFMTVIMTVRVYFTLSTIRVQFCMSQGLK